MARRRRARPRRGTRSGRRFSRSAARRSRRTRFLQVFVSSRRSTWPRRESWRAAMRSVIVTGGSRGLGLGIVRKLAEDGQRPIAIARKLSDELAAAIEQADRDCPGRIRFVPCDLSDVAAIPELVKELRRTVGPMYGLVNNAGIGTTG